MGYLVLTECRLRPGVMQQFTALVQAWEQDALRHEDAPRYHAVFLGADDPERALVLTEFASREAAQSFEVAGLLSNFRDSVVRCLVTPAATTDGYDLFYAATPSGPAVTFGEATARP